MKNWTYGEGRAKIALDLDLQNETNITADEMAGYFNEAISEAAAEIHKTNEDYFLKSSIITLINGQAAYSLPSDIYANKIRNMTYNNGSGVIYPMRRIRGGAETKFTDLALTNYFGTAYDYRYIIQNVSSAVGYQLVLVPAARESGGVVTMWYLRDANYIPMISSGSQAASDGVVIDIPEFYTFILQFVKVRCLEKDGADPRLPQAVQILEHEREMMVSTLTQMVPDDDDTVVPDYSHYYEHE